MQRDRRGIAGQARNDRITSAMTEKAKYYFFSLPLLQIFQTYDFS